MKTIKLLYQGTMAPTFSRARAGEVWRLFIHGLAYPPELRAKPPRVRLLEDSHPGHVLAELVDPWPDAPEFWPPESAPKPKAADHGRNAA